MDPLRHIGHGAPWRGDDRRSAGDGNRLFAQQTYRSAADRCRSSPVPPARQATCIRP